LVVFPLLFATPQLLEFPIDFALNSLLSSVLSFVFPQLFAFSLFLLIFVPISHTFLISLLFILLAFLCCWIFSLFYSPLFFSPFPSYSCYYPFSSFSHCFPHPQSPAS